MPDARLAARTTPRLAARPRRVAAGLMLAVFCGWAPVAELCLGLLRVPFDHGAGRAALAAWGRELDWFARFFTGPPADEALRRHFRRHRATFLLLARLYADGQCPGGRACARLAARLGMRVAPLSIWLLNAQTAPPAPGPCGAPCWLLKFTPAERRQNWWRNRNPAIAAWVKGIAYVPPLVPGRDKGQTGDWPTDPDTVMHRRCRFHRASLDVPAPGLMADRRGLDDCAFTRLEAHWYLIQYPILP